MATCGTYFSAPRTGRKIDAIFSYLQRIGKGATTEVSFPSATAGASPSPISWGAVRQFELLQEAGNLAIDELDVADFKRAYQNLMRMRSGGYRVTLITLGHYTDRSMRDELEILDKKIQDEITQLIHFLYLSEMSEQGTAYFTASLNTGKWSLDEALPHVAQTRTARSLFKPEKETLREKTFFDILDKLSNRSVLHETAIGLVLPDASKEKNWVYIAQRENRFQAFQQAITTVFENLDEDRAVMTHMRGYGDRWERPVLCA